MELPFFPWTGPRITGFGITMTLSWRSCTDINSSMTSVMELFNTEIENLVLNDQQLPSSLYFDMNVALHVEYSQA